MNNTAYESPKIEIIKLSVTDIITTSGDSNGTEWDPVNVY